MTTLEYQMLQDKLTRKYQHCNGLGGKRKEGYQEAILNVKSMLHELYRHRSQDECAQNRSERLVPKDGR